MNDLNHLSLNDLMKIYHDEVDNSGAKANEMLSKVYSARAFNGWIQNLVRKKLVDEHLREDAISEFFTRLFILGKSKEKRWNPEKSSFTTWAYIHLERICIDIHRKTKRKVKSRGKNKTYRETKTIGDWNIMDSETYSDPWDEFFDKEELNVLKQLLDQVLPNLPEDQRLIINLLKDGKQGNEVARILDINPSVVTRKKTKAAITIRHSRNFDQDCGNAMF